MREKVKSAVATGGNIVLGTHRLPTCRIRPGINHRVDLWFQEKGNKRQEFYSDLME